MESGDQNGRNGVRFLNRLNIDGYTLSTPGSVNLTDDRHIDLINNFTGNQNAI